MDNVVANINGYLIAELETCTAINTYIYYDEPLFYSAYSSAGLFYLFLAVSDLESESGKLWIVKPISEANLLDFEYGLVTSRDVLTTRGELIYFVEICDDEILGLTFGKSSELIDTQLPKQGLRYKVRENQFPILMSDCDIASREMKKPIVDFSIGHSDKKRKVDSLVVSEAITLFQKMNWSIGLANASTAKGDRARDKKNIVFEAVRPFAASYGFRLAPVSEELSEKEIQFLKSGVDGILSLIDNATDYLATDSKDSLTVYNELNFNQQGCFLKFVKLLSDNDVDLKITASDGESTSRKVLKAAGSTHFVNSVKAEREETETFTCLGRLSAHDSDNNTFTFKADSRFFDKKTFSGKLNESIQGRAYTTPSRVLAEITCTKITNLITDNVTLKFVLNSVQKQSKKR
ncbi:MAG: hypothetical protein EOP06_02350 [Proteobacteria bacterium]|nr:MAG: hypothetical protein EOP06_02350 [Pseudomonadota bacterium]